MRESDDRAIARSRVHVDTRAGALKEAGDIVQPIANGTIAETDVIADLFELARGQQTGRLAGDATTITLFKSVGAALEDLAAAELAVELALPVSGEVSASSLTEASCNRSVQISRSICNLRAATRISPSARRWPPRLRRRRERGQILRRFDHCAGRLEGLDLVGREPGFRQHSA